jgi:hypothetical protein
MRRCMVPIRLGVDLTCLRVDPMLWRINLTLCHLFIELPPKAAPLVSSVSTYVEVAISWVYLLLLSFSMFFIFIFLVFCNLLFVAFVLFAFLSSSFSVI